jgi:hypothetical protein
MTAWAMRALAVALSSLAAVALLMAAELALRAAGPDREAAGADGFARAHRYSETLGWVPRADFAYTARGVAYTLNAAGTRGAHYGPARRPGTVRAVLLGDSLTYGYGVGDEQTFARLVDDARPDVEIVNLGVQGYGLDQSRLALEARGLAYRPDVVVLDVCAGNDFLDDLLPTFLYDARHAKPFFAVEGDALVRHDGHLRLSAPMRLGRALRERSVLVDRLSRLVGGADLVDGADEEGATAAAILDRRLQLPGSEPLSLREALALPPERQAAFWHAANEVSFRVVAEIGRVARAHGADYLVLVFPSDPSHFVPGSWYEAQLADARTRPYLHDVRVVDVGEAFARHGVVVDTFGRFYLDQHCHLSPAGHRLAAEVLGALLREGGRDSH